MSASTQAKTGVQVSARRSGARIRWRDVLGAVQDSAERTALVRHLGDAGFAIDDFANLVAARDAVCQWLSRYEDRLEGKTGTRKPAERLAVMQVRRRLECELHP